MSCSTAILAELSARNLSLEQVSIRTMYMSIHVATGSTGVATTEISEDSFAVLERVHGYEYVNSAVSVPPVLVNSYKLSADNEIIGFSDSNLKPVFGYLVTNRNLFGFEGFAIRTFRGGSLRLEGSGAAQAKFTAILQVVSPRL